MPTTGALTTLAELQRSKAEALGVPVESVTVKGYKEVLGYAVPEEMSLVEAVPGAIQQRIKDITSTSEVATMNGQVPETELATAGLPAVVSTLPALLGGAASALPALGTLAGVAGGVYGILQALGLGEGGGIGGINLLGGDEFTMGGLTFGGPGLSEPGQGDFKLVKEWRSGEKQFYYLVPRVATDKRRPRGAMYDRVTGTWKVWVWPKPRLAVIGKNMPSHKMITRLRRNLSKQRADADTILRLTSPKYQAYKSRARSRRR